MEGPSTPSANITEPELSFTNVGLAFSFILVNVVLSSVLELGIESSLLIAAVRCVIQLSIAASLLEKIFEAKNAWVVASIACILNILGTFETVVNKAKRRHQSMFLSTLTGMLISSIPVAVIGSRFAMSIEPFWDPMQFIPVVGMLCGSAISGVVVSGTYLLREMEVNRDKVEMLLAFGATRREACKPIAIEALRLALMPTINSMSVLGIISIPGMMTGAILGGASVERAAMLQMIIMFMISASNTLACIFTTISALGVIVDAEHRIRGDRIDNKEHVIWRMRGQLWMRMKMVAQKIYKTWRLSRIRESEDVEVL